MKDLHGEEGTSRLQRVSGKKYVKIAIAAVGIFAILFLLVFAVFIKPMLEKKIIEEQISKYMEEIKAGYLIETDYDIPSEVYVYVTGSLNPYVKSAADYILGGEESLKRGWQDIMKYMEYSVDAIEKDGEGNYIICITFTNRNLALILTETIQEMKGEKGKLVFDAISGNIDEQFWESFEMHRDVETENVSKSYQLRIIKEEDGNWTLDTDYLDFRILGSMAGLEDQYLDMLKIQAK